MARRSQCGVEFEFSEKLKLGLVLSKQNINRLIMRSSEFNSTIPTINTQQS
jgi:hypothetical protein